MDSWTNDLLLPLVISNIVVLGILYFCWENERIGRLLMFLLFLTAGCVNWYTVLHRPTDYLYYESFAFISLYRSFIEGWFSQHIQLMVGIIATSQLLIAFSMLLKGWIFKAGALGGMLFLLCILPLGFAAAFPFPIFGAIAFYILLTSKGINYIWKHSIVHDPTTAFAD